MLKKLLFILFCLQALLFAGIKSDEILKVMESKINQATELIRENKNNQTDITQTLYDILDPVFDYSLMARLSLGSKQFKSLSQAQQETFTDEFVHSLKNSFKDSLSLYSDEKVSIDTLLDVKNRKVLKTKLLGSKKTYDIDYKFHEKDSDSWLIYDISIANVSIVQTYRSQFSNILEDKGFDGLLEMLKRTKIDIEQ